MKSLKNDTNTILTFKNSPNDIIYSVSSDVKRYFNVGKFITIHVHLLPKLEQ